MPDNETGIAESKQQGQTQEQESQVTSFAEWLAGQDDEVKGLIDGEIKGLKNALASEREARKARERELREAARKLEEGSAARKIVEEQADKLRTLERQAAFYDAAHAKGCSNLRLAFIAAQDAGLVRDDGSADWEELRRRFPELFTTKTNSTRGHAADGNENSAPRPQGMDAFIRAAAGLRPR